MKKIFYTLVFLFLFGSSIFATGIGIIFMKDPSVGISLKSGNSVNCYDAALSWQSGIYFHADYLHNFYFISRHLPLYVGLGLYTDVGNDFTLGLRVPLGIDFYFSKLDFFVEVVPSLELFPDMGFSSKANLGAGLRYNFRL